MIDKAAAYAELMMLRKRLAALGDKAGVNAASECASLWESIYRLEKIIGEKK